MDCIIPSHSVRPFCTAIACLSRIGKDMYLEFDPLVGLTLRTLNDAKSAYSSIVWEPSFFEKCSAPPTSRKRRSQEQDDDDEDCFSCRVTLRSLAAVVKSRRHVQSLRVYSEISNDVHFLTFEFQICKTGMLTVVHRIPVAQDAHRILSTMPKEGASEIIASPRVLLKMLEPLYKKSPEVAFIINNVYKIVTATTFQHGDANAVSNALLNASAPSLLKTETCISVDELEEFDFRDDRKEETDDEASAASTGVPPPTNVNDEVALVFVAKEAKALLQFGAQAIPNDELFVSLTFHWGGKPMLLEVKGPSFSAQLIMATLDHKLLGGLKRVNPETVAAERRVSSSRAGKNNDYAAVAASS